MDQNESVAALIVAIIYLVSILIGYLISSLLLHHVFKKLGIAQWRAWVPFANSAAVLQAGGNSGWWAAGLLVPGLSIVTVVFLILSYYRLGKGLRIDDTLNVISAVLGFWVIVVLITQRPFDHRFTGVQTRQPEQLAAIAAGGLIDPSVPAPGFSYGHAPRQQGYQGHPQPGYPQQQGYPQQPGHPPQGPQNPYGGQQQNPFGGQ